MCWLAEPMVRTHSDQGLVPRLRRGQVLAALVLWAAALSGPAQAQTVFACEPEWAALSRVLLPEAKLHVATHAGQDPHHIEARPALIAQMRQADLVVCTGAGLESGWLPVLQQRAGNPKAQEAYWASDHVVMIDPQPAASSHWHPLGGRCACRGQPACACGPAQPASGGPSTGRAHAGSLAG